MTQVMVRDHPHMTSALNGQGGRVNTRRNGIWVNSILTREGSEILNILRTSYLDYPSLKLSSVADGDITLFGR